MMEQKSMYNRTWIIAPAFAMAALLCPGTAQAQAPYKVQQRWAIGGEGSWDYMTVDAAARRLYIAHQTRVEVVDLGTGKSIGSVQGLTRCHGIVMAPDGKTGFISDGGADSVVVFDPSNMATIARIPAGTNPDGMLYEPVTRTLWAFNGGSKNVTVIDVAQRKAIATIAMPGKPEFPATDGSGTIFVNVEDNNSIVRIDAKSRKLTATWKLPGCESPSGLAIDIGGGRLFSVCDGKKMAITDSHTGKSLGTPNIGDGADATAYDAAHKLVFASNEDGTLSIIDASKPGFRTVQTLPTMKGARTLAFDATTGKVYTVSAKLGAAPAANFAVHHNRPTAIPGTFTVLVMGLD
jgi:YVTN family beta-propeller protein